MRFSFVLYSLLVLIQIGFPSIIYSQDTIPSQIIEEVVFVANKIYEPTSLKITNRDFKRLAASFDDPSRILMHYPGFSNANDQANGIIYHGLPSHFSGWQLNGLEIVNPNHLSNAGTFSDFSTLAAGGVNMFSGNIINNYQYNTALSSAMRGTALAGISNIIIDSLDKNYVQASLLGFEVGLRKKVSNHSFFGSYRYSFTGLLGKLGVNFGNEEIAFSDGMIGYSYKKGRSNFTFIVANGTSSNDYTNNRYNIQTFKDYFDITYKSNINIIQGQYLFSSEKNLLELGFSYSDKGDYRNSYTVLKLNQNDSIQILNEKNLYSSKLVFHQSFKLGEWFKIGMKEIRDVINYENYEYNQPGNDYNDTYWQIIPYIKKDLKISNFYLDFNLSGVLNDEFTYMPSGNIKYNYRQHSLSIALSKSAQFFSPYNYSRFYTKSQNFDLNYQYNSNKLNFHLGWFKHKIEAIPSGKLYYSAINHLNLFEVEDLFVSSKAKSSGFYIHLNKNLKYNFWINFNATFFDLIFSEDRIDWFNAETNFGNIFNINAGKKISLKNATLNISSSFHYRGGAYQYQPIEGLIPSFDYYIPPTIRLGDYKRLDLRINYIKGKAFWSLDIQNVLNTLNDAYQYYDIGGLRTQKQLGIIPVLTYKYSF